MAHYLDYNATAPLRPEVVAAMRELEGLPLNPSSAHAMGRKAKAILENARCVIAETVSAFANEIIFTSSGTEANNWALKAFPAHSLFVSAIEHSSVLKTAPSLPKSSVIPVTADGIIDVETLEKLLPQEENFLVSVMLTNNETGAIQPIREIAGIVHKRGGLLHCDAVQALGKIPLDFTYLACDLMTIAGHKMGGPVGAAALIAKNNLPLPPFFTGGGQELNRRAGTENIVAISGFAKAAEHIDIAHMQKVKAWLCAFELEINGLGTIIAEQAIRLPNTTCVAMPGVTSETQLISFDLQDIAVSAGSACSSGRIEPSHVLKAMGLSDAIAGTAIRISGGWDTQEKDIAALKSAWKKLFTAKNASLEKTAV